MFIIWSSIMNIEVLNKIKLHTYAYIAINSNFWTYITGMYFQFTNEILFISNSS